MATKRTKLDPVTLELVWTRLISAVDEAAKAIVRTSFSTLSNEANDFACVLTDAEGGSLAQNTGSIPSFIGTLPATVRAIRAAIPPETMRPGDVYITNNPWIGTGHLNDVSLVRPVFHGGRIVAFGATTSHVPDIGGRIRSTEARELFEEGFHIPPMRFMRDGEADASLITLLRTNDEFWKPWFETAGLDWPEPDRGPLYSDSALLMQAAAEGQGIALGRRSLLANDERNGVLVRPFAIETPGERRIYLVYPPRNADSPKVAAFRAWIKAEIAAEARG